MYVMDRVRDIRTKPTQTFVELDEFFWMAGQDGSADQVTPHGCWVLLAPEQVVDQATEILSLLGPGDHRRLSSS